MRASRHAAFTVATFACGGLVAGCTADPGNGPGTPPSPARATHSAAAPGSAAPASRPNKPIGTVAGRVVRPPGIDPRSGSVGGGTPSHVPVNMVVPVNSDPIEARDAAGRLAGSATSRPPGAFRLTLPVGSYRIVEGICGVARRVDVRGGETSSVTLRIPNAC